MEMRTENGQPGAGSSDTGSPGRGPSGTESSGDRRRLPLRRGDQSRRVTSITRRIHWHLIKQRLGTCVGLDLLILVGGAFTWLAGQEYAKLGKLVWAGYDRVFTNGTGNTIYYIVTDSDTHKSVLRTAINQPLSVLLCVGGVLLGLQLLGILFGYLRENRRIRKILSPLNELAIRADELNRISFSEDKYQLLEDAIEKIKPDEAQPLSFGDSDLQGVEAAMNNLLIRMRDTYRQQARFVNDASHELRTPIAVIQGYANMLDRWGKEDEKILDESITAIRSESDHMNHLVEQLLFLARGDSGRTAVKLETVDLCAMMREIYEESLMIDEKHLYRFAKVAESSENELFMEADPALLKQAVRILIDNAAKYTKEGDEILLDCGRTPGGSIYLQVQDTGIGMSEPDVRHMFERFYRSDEVRSYQGTGLGLSIAKWIVDKHGGHFETLSRTGLGTRIRIVLDEK